MIASDAQKKASEKWEKEKIYSFKVRIPLSKKEKVQECANKNNESINAMINRLIDQELESKNIK